MSAPVLPGRLGPIVHDVARRAAARRAERPLDVLRREVQPQPARRRRFLDALLAGPGPGVIAECKRRSPSAGDLAPGVDLAERAAAYARGGASCLSVLTEEDHFAGSLADLRAVGTTLPRLRKDFLLDEGMVLESAAAGADAVLLLACVLDDARLAELRVLAGELGLAVLLEVHDEVELDRALAVSPDLLGVNARDLTTFRVDPARAAELLARVPSEVPAVAESGIRSAADVRRAAAAGARALLVGETLMRAVRPDTVLRGWRSQFAPPRSKVCGLTRERDVAVALSAGADAVGLVFAPSSPRAVTPARGAELAEAASDALVVGVFAGVARDEAERIAVEVGLHAVQLCGDERPEDFADFPLPVWRRLPVDAVSGPREAAAWRDVAALFVLDHPAAAGGTGRRVDFEVAARLAADLPCLLAGGLDAAALPAAASAGALGFDASSALESAPGRKDPERVRAFVRTAHELLA